MTKDRAAKRKYSKKSIIAVILILSVMLFESFLGGNIVFYSKWLECKGRPVQSSLEWSFAGQPRYYEESKVLRIVRLYPDYFCTPLEAEQAGYSASRNEHSFPHLWELQKKTQDTEDSVDSNEPN